MRILHISDLHYSDNYQLHESAYTKLMSQMDNPLKQLNTVLQQDKEYDLVLLSGDICEYGSTEEYRKVKQYLDDYFHCPVLVTAGNHDEINNLISGFELETEEGELFEVHDINGLRVICLNSGSAEYNDGYISEKSCDLLEKTLKTDKDIIVMTHHHLIRNQFVMPAAEYPARLCQIIRDSNVMAVLTGHTHHFYEGEFEGKPYYTTGSLSFVVDQNKKGELEFYENPCAVVYEYHDHRLSAERVISGKDIRKIGILEL